MKRTRPTVLLGLALAAGVAAYLLELLGQSLGANVIVPPLSLTLTLVAIGIAVILLAIPVRRSVTGKRKARLDPFYALRVAVFAKASSLAGSLFAGAAVGIVLFLFGRPITPSVTMSTVAISEIVAGVFLVAAGLIAEHLCVLPPDDPQDPRGKSLSEPAA